MNLNREINNKTVIDNISAWTREWRMKHNETKLTYINFIYQRTYERSIFDNGVKIPSAKSVKDLGMTLKAKRLWKAHVNQKHEDLYIKSRNLYWLLRYWSELSIHKKLLSYFCIIKCWDQYGLIMPNCGDVRKNATLMKFSDYRTKCWNL